MCHLSTNPKTFEFIGVDLVGEKGEKGRREGEYADLVPETGVKVV